MGMFMAIVKSDIFVDFRSPYVDTAASCYVSLQISIKLRETFRNKTKNGAPHNRETWICCIFMSFLRQFIFLASFADGFQIYFFIA